MRLGQVLGEIVAGAAPNAVIGLAGLSHRAYLAPAGISAVNR
jgi:hypothetical protein